MHTLTSIFFVSICFKMSQLSPRTSVQFISISNNPGITAETPPKCQGLWVQGEQCLHVTACSLSQLEGQA